MSRLDEVFGVARDLPANYVIRHTVDDSFVEALGRDQHIVIFGSSKQGKTCLRKHNLEPREYVIATCSNRWSLGQLNSAILKAAGYTVEGSTKKTVSGAGKISATLSGKAGILRSNIGGELAGELQGGIEQQSESRPLEIDPFDVNDVIEALEASNCPKFIVLEDFHYLPEETQRDFAVALKAFHEDSSFCFIIVGVWRDQNRIIQQNGDLTGRVVSVDADRWTRGELLEVIQSGERLLNVHFSDDFKFNLLDGCFNNVYIVQESCRLACQDKGVYETAKKTVEIVADASTLIGEAVNAHSARYNGFILNFAAGFQTSVLEMYKWILWPVLTATSADLERGISYGRIRSSINSVHPESPINPGNITQALQSTASLQVGKMQIKPIILDYDETNRRLNVVDRSFMIWLQHQNRSDLLELAELPAVDSE